LPPLQKQLAQQRDLLTALAGRFPSEEPPEKFELAALRLPRDLPVSLPSKLIEQRPDVRSAEALLHSASAQVGVAVANMLPALTISATGGYTAAVLPGLISPANEFWTLAGSATQPVFDGFTLLHQKRAAEDAYDQAAAQYRSTVIGALQNVADTLRALQADADALKAAVEFEHAADVSLTLIRQQMQSGYSNVLLLLTAEQALLQARLTVIQARASRLADTVALYQALGGGWWNRTDVASEKPLELIPIKPVAVSAKPRDVGSLRSADGASARRLAITAGRPVALLRRPGVWRSGSDVAMADAGDVVPKQPVDVVAQEYRDAAADQAGDDALADAINAALVDRAAGAATDQPPGGDFANRRALAWQLPADVAAARPLSSAGWRD